MFPELSQNSTSYLTKKSEELADKVTTDSNSEYLDAKNKDKQESTRTGVNTTKNQDKYRKDAVERAKDAITANDTTYQAYKQAEDNANTKSLEDSNKINEQIDKQLQNDIQIGSSDPNASWKNLDKQYESAYGVKAKPVNLQNDITITNGGK